jgi:hypothetical protein
MDLLLSSFSFFFSFSPPFFFSLRLGRKEREKVKKELVSERETEGEEETKRERD